VRRSVENASYQKQYEQKGKHKSIRPEQSVIYKECRKKKFTTDETKD